MKKFSDTGTNGNGSTWTQYSATFNSGANTQISVGFKLGHIGRRGAHGVVGYAPGAVRCEKTDSKHSLRIRQTVAAGAASTDRSLPPHLTTWTTIVRPRNKPAQAGPMPPMKRQSRLSLPCCPSV